MGWIHRLLHFWLEWFLSNVSNKTKITVGSFDYDLWHGRVYATNVLIHTPLQEEWKWSSPIIARIGRIYVEFSLLQWLLQVVTLLSLERAPIDILTVQVMDVQGFIERQDQVFNFYLLDESIILPDPKTIVGDNSSNSDETSDDDDDDDEMNQRRRQEHSVEATRGDNSNVPQDVTSDSANTTIEEDEEEAQQLVDSMLQTVQQVMSRKGTWKGALEEQRQSLTCKLRELQSTPNKVSAVEKHVRVMRQVGEAVAKKTQDLPTVTAPLRRESLQAPPMVRVGRVVVRDARIFTRYSTLDRESQDVLLKTWNKPIRIDQVTVRASELTPPMSLVEEGNCLPAIYQPLDKVWEVVWKRLLAESAKSQGGKLLNAAIGQVLGFMKEK